MDIYWLLKFVWTYKILLMIYKNKNKLFGRLLKNLNKQPSISFEMRDLKFVFVFTFCTFQYWVYTKRNEEKYKPNMNKEDNNTRELDLSNGNWIKIELDQVVIIMFLGYKFGHIIQNNWINTVAVFFLLHYRNKFCSQRF